MAATVVLAARVVGLDIAGIDLVAGDISKPLADQRGAIVEVNAGPGLLMHLKPGVGEPRPVGEAIASHLFPEHGSGRIPIIGVSGTSGCSEVARVAAYLIGLEERLTGLACADGSFLGKRTVFQGNHDRHASGRQLLMNPRVEAAVIENGPLSILDDGLAYDRCRSASSPTPRPRTVRCALRKTIPRSSSTCCGRKSTSCCPTAMRY